MTLLLIILLILFNGLLSMTEIAVVSARKSKLDAQVKKGKRWAARVTALKEKPERFLSTIQIGITLIGVLTGLLSGERFAGVLGSVLEGWGLSPAYAPGVAKTVIVALVTYFTLIFGELVPKRLGLWKPERVAGALVGLMKVLSTVCAPFVWLLSRSTQGLTRLLGVKDGEESKVTEEEIRAMIEEGTEDGEIEEVEQDIVGRVFTLGDRNVGSIMTHRGELVWLDLQDTAETHRSQILENLHDIYPVADGQIDDVVGVVFLKDLFGRMDGDWDLKALVREPLFFPSTMNVYDALEALRAQYSKYALVTDEFGGLQGMVTLADIMEAMLGEIPENREDELIVLRADGSSLIDGQCPFYHFLEHFDMEALASEYNYNTLSGLILDELGHLPSEGERLQWRGLGIEIVDMDRPRIDKVLVTPLPQAPEA